MLASTATFCLSAGEVEKSTKKKDFDAFDVDPNNPFDVDYSDDASDGDSSVK